jgi:hypothetical protein
MSRAIAALFAIVSTALFGQLAEFEVASVRPHAAGVPGTYPPTGGVGTSDPERSSTTALLWELFFSLLST